MSASQSRQVMRLKPKRCSRRKVRVQLERQLEQAPIDGEGGEQRELVGQGAAARLRPRRARRVQRVEAAEQRPAEQHGGAERPSASSARRALASV